MVHSRRLREGSARWNRSAAFAEMKSLLAGAEVELLLRSKDNGGRLLTVHATVRELPPDSPEWDAAVEVLRPERLNAVGDVAERWRQSCTIHVLTPHGRPVESPGSYAEESGRTTVDPAGAATAGWRPWHWRGRAGARRNVRGT